MNIEQYRKRIELLYYMWHTVTPKFYQSIDIATAVYNWSVNWGRSGAYAAEITIHELYDFNLIDDWPINKPTPEGKPYHSPLTDLLERFDNNPILAGHHIQNIRYYITPEGDTAIKRELLQGSLSACITPNGIDWRKADNIDNDGLIGTFIETERGPIDKVKLKKIMLDLLVLDDLRDLCFDIGLDYEYSENTGKLGLIRWVIRVTSTNNKTLTLIDGIMLRKPQLNFADFAVTVCD